MAFLMLLHEKMRLQRKQNKLTLKQLRNGNQLSRMESRIKKREKYYSKLQKQIETQANLYKNQAKMFIDQQCGVGGWNPNSVFAGGGVGLTQNAYAYVQQNAGGFSDAVMRYLEQGQLAFKQNEITGSDGKKTYEYTCTDGKTYSAEDFNKITGFAQNARMASQQANQMAQQWNNDYINNISIWEQQQKEYLDMQQEWEMDLLAEEQSEYEAEKESIAAELELIKQRKESIEQELGSSIKDAAPKFGLA